MDKLDSASLRKNCLTVTVGLHYVLNWFVMGLRQQNQWLMGSIQKLRQQNKECDCNEFKTVCIQPQLARPF